MQKLCCFPLNDPPSINVNLKCTTSCCGSRMVTSQRNTDSVDGKISENTKAIEKEEEEKSKSCCCYDIKKGFQRQSHAKEDKHNEVTELNDE